MLICMKYLVSCKAHKHFSVNLLFHNLVPIAAFEIMNIQPLKGTAIWYHGKTYEIVFHSKPRLLILTLRCLKLVMILEKVT